LSAGQFRVSAGAGSTVKVALHVSVALQLLVRVKVTVTEPPHAGGGPLLLFVKTALQPPAGTAVCNQLLKL
jgi:hypothetical protein